MAESIVNETAADAEEKNYGHFELELKRPLKTADGEVEKLIFDFDGLTGADGLAVENEIRTVSQRVVLVQASDTEYLIKLACKACDKKIGAATLENVCIADFNRIVGAMRGFLIRSE